MNDTPRRTDIGRPESSPSTVVLVCANAAGAVEAVVRAAWAASDDPPTAPTATPGSIFSPSVLWFRSSRPPTADQLGSNLAKPGARRGRPAVRPAHASRRLAPSQALVLQHRNVAGPEREWEDIAYHSSKEGGVDLVPRRLRHPGSVRGPGRGGGADGAWLVRRFEMDLGRLTGHRDHAPTSCPGEKLYRAAPISTPRLAAARWIWAWVIVYVMRSSHAAARPPEMRMSSVQRKRRTEGRCVDVGGAVTSSGSPSTAYSQKA